MKTLYVAGSFDDKGGRESKIAHQIFQPIKEEDADFNNGGYFGDLEKIVEKARDYDVIYWFANVPNNKPKLIKRIKKENSKCILVTSKRNTDCKYAFGDLIARALGLKSNLLLEFVCKDNLYRGRVLDPLGNVFVDFTEDFSLIGNVLKKRVNELAGYTRVSSMSVGEEKDIPDANEFFELANYYAGLFHNLVHFSVGAARFMGNVSFRCEKGFPSFRANDLIYVSRRNVDKRCIKKDSFVAVEKAMPVRFYGKNKPSVDAPSQILLYNYYPGTRYMLHSHVYVDNAPFTGEIIPCGAIEESNEIAKIYPNSKSTNFAINLKGHGSLVLADNIEYLKSMPYKARRMPEVCHKWNSGIVND